MRAGWVYVFVNEGLRGYVKVGETSRTPDIRRKEVKRSYGTPFPWKVDKPSHFVDDRRAVETMAHHLLRTGRVKNSEVFRCAPEDAHRAIVRAALIVHEQRWYMRMWYRMILPRPERAHNAGGGRGTPQRHNPWQLFLVAVAVLCVWLLRHYQPALPDWLPDGALRRTALQVEVR